jgi:hypothetical protein
MRPIHSSILALAALLFVTTPALAESKVSQCKRLRISDQKLQTQMHKVMRQTNGDPLDKIGQLLKVLENGTQQIQAMRLEDAKLEGFKQRVIEVYAKDHDDLVDAYEAAVRQDQAATKNALQKVDKGQTKERSTLPRQARQYCGFSVLENIR